MPGAPRAPAAARSGRVGARTVRARAEGADGVRGNVGVLGGGQLGQMMASAAARMGVRITVLDPTGAPGAPATLAGADQVVGAFRGDGAAAAVRALAARSDVLTVEVEHVDCDALEACGKDVQPSAGTVRLLQDKYRQKVHLERAARVPVAPYREINGGADLRDAVREFGLPMLLKRRRLAYDGRGNHTLRDPGRLDEAAAALGGFDEGAGAGGALYAEQFVEFEKELAVMVVRARGAAGADASLHAYPAVETVHTDHICDRVVAPAPIDEALAEEAREIAVQAVGSLGGFGIFGVEMFLLAGRIDSGAARARGRSGRIVVNEIAPRPHNSGHYTIEACHCSQFENHIRAVLGWPIGLCEMAPAGAGGAPGGCHAQMVNIIGRDDGRRGDAIASIEYRAALRHPSARVHWYGKSTRNKRKLGHYTVVGRSRGEVEEAAAAIRGEIEAEIAGLPESMDGGAPEEDARAGARAGGGAAAPVVGIIMGSDSDLPTMRPAAELLEDRFGVPVELTVVSAHRTPARLFEYARSASARGLRVIIAGAGGAAHLPGMVASLTPLPVIGVPIIPSSGSMGALNGMDALLSIVQMPKGIPVATVAIGNAANGALLAARILGSGDGAPGGVDAAGIRAKMEAYQRDMEDVVLGKVQKIDDVGYRAYDDDMRR